MIIEFTKIPGGLRWDNQNRLFTYSIYPNGYEIQGIDLCQIEMNNQLFMLCSNDSKIDGISFSNIQDEIAYVYS